MAEDRCAHGHRGPMALDGTGCPTCLGETVRRLFEALDSIKGFQPYQQIHGLLDELRPHVVKEGA